MSSTVAQKKVKQAEALYTLKFLFNSGNYEPSDISGLPRSQVYRFGCEDLMGWIDISEEDAVKIIDDLLMKIDDGKGSRHSFVFPNGETFAICLDS